jgi:hypothetical protein
MICVARADDLHAALSRPYEERRKKAEIPFLESISYLNREPSATQILVLPPFVATYYLHKDYVKPIGRWGERTFSQSASWEQIVADPRLRITHVLDASLADAPLQLGAATAQLRLVYKSAGQRVYAVIRH